MRRTWPSLSQGQQIGSCPAPTHHLEGVDGLGLNAQAQPDAYVSLSRSPLRNELFRYVCIVAVETLDRRLRNRIVRDGRIAHDCLSASLVSRRWLPWLSIVVVMSVSRTDRFVSVEQAP